LNGNSYADHETAAAAAAGWANGHPPHHNGHPQAHDGSSSNNGGDSFSYGGGGATVKLALNGVRKRPARSGAVKVDLSCADKSIRRPGSAPDLIRKSHRLF
jgi:hypothetical protein